MRIAQFIVVLLLAGCSGPGYTVRQYGGMRESLRDGRSHARVTLGQAIGPTTIAVGAMEGLEGEITALDGRVWIARRDDASVTISGASPADGAALLTAADIPAWQTADLALAEPGAGPAADRAIESAARAAGIDTSRPFPFTLEGAFGTLEVHVIHGACPIAHPDLSPEQEPWRWSAGGSLVRATLVGFYAPNAAGVMTHHGTSLHVHAVVEAGGQTFAGHVERFELPADAVLALPRRTGAAR